MSTFDLSRIGAPSIVNTMNIASGRATKNAKSLANGKAVLGSSFYDSVRDARAKSALGRKVGASIMANTLRTSNSKIQQCINQFDKIYDVLLAAKELAVRATDANLNATVRAEMDNTYDEYVAEITALTAEQDGGVTIIFTANSTVLLDPNDTTVSVELDSSTALWIEDTAVATTGIDSAANAINAVDKIDDAIADCLETRNTYAADYELLANYIELNELKAGDAADIQADFESLNIAEIGASIAMDKLTVEQGNAMLASLVAMAQSDTAWISRYV